MLCIGLLVDVIYTAVVFFIDDFVTTAVLWLVIGTICVGELNQDRYRNYCAMKVVDQSCQLDIAYNVMTHSCGTSPNDKTKLSRIAQQKTTLKLKHHLIVFAVIYFYMWAVVLSHFLQLKEQNDRGQYSRTPYRR